MAAFIQKLFGRKSTSPAKTKAPESKSPELKQEKSDRQEELLKQQLSVLASSPATAELERLAIEGITADIRLKAAESLDDKEALQRVQKAAKGKDKGVYQTVKATLQTYRQKEEEQKQREENVDSLIRQAEELARTEDLKLYQQRLEALKNHWAQIEDAASPAQTETFLGKIRDCNNKLNELNEEKARLSQQREQKTQRDETLTLLNETLDDLKAPTSSTEPSVASLDALQKTQETRWLEATRDTPVEKQEQKSYESLMQPLKLYIAALRKFVQNRDSLKAAVEETETSASSDRQSNAKQLVETIEWPDDFPMPPLLKDVAQVAGRKPAARKATPDTEDQKAAVDSFKGTLASLEQTLESKQLKESKQLFKTAQQQIQALDKAHSRSLQPRLQLLGGQLRELSDWQGFATRPKQIELCEQMEYLSEQPIEPEAKAERIKELQNEWRELGGSSDRELWGRFKQASDKAYEPCKEYFSAKSGLKQANLETRRSIVDQLRTFIENADWQTIDWKAAERIHQKAREEWKVAWPIDFKANRPLQKDFDGLLKQIEEPLNQERHRNEELKQAIVEKAQALISHEPLGEAMQQAKALQGEWKQVGLTRHREDRKLWQAFRQACDQIFARRDAARNEQQALSDAADQKAQTVLDGLEDNISPAEKITQLDAISAEPLSPAMKSRVSEMRSRLSSQLKQEEAKQKIALWEKLADARLKGTLDSSEMPDNWPTLASQVEEANARDLVIRAEILTELPSPEDDQSRRMEIQVQRLADGMGSVSDDASVLQTIEPLVACWCMLPEDATPDGAQAQRLIDALKAASNA